MKKRLVSLLVALVLVLGIVPFNAMASEEAYVYLSISFDGKYINDNNGSPIAYLPISMKDIADVDLSAYGLGNMLFDSDGDGSYETTALQLLIYAHEKIYGGKWSDVNFSALPGSSYFAGGIFGFTENLVYFHNGDFPVDESQQSDSMTVGATSDRIVLKAGDFLDVASFSCFSFLWDQLGGFHLFSDPDGNYVHDYAATAGESLAVKVKHSFCDLMFGQSWVKDAADYEVFYGAVFGEAEGSVTTDENGNATITFPSAGTYYVWCDGGNGSDDGTHIACGGGEPCIVSSPAYAKVTVEEDGKEGSEPEPPRQPQDVSAVLNAALAKQVETVPAPAFGTNYGEWTVFGLARANYLAKDNQYFKDYYTRILGYVDLTAATVNLNGALHKTKSTDNSRLIMALSSIGIDSTAVGEWDLVDAYSKNGLNWIKKQGINGTIWALIALDTGNYETSDPTIRQQCVDSLLSLQHTDGGWSLVTALAQPSNVDITGMALTALYPDRNQPAVAEACAEAIAWMSQAQLENGGFPYGDGETSESCAWAIVSLTMWGIDPDTDPRFIKNGKSAIDNLLSYYNEADHMFAHQGTESNAMATDQCSYALVAYTRFVKGDKALYDMSDVEITKSTQQVIRPESVTLPVTEVTLNIGERLELTPTVTPAEASNQNVKWSTADKNIAAAANVSGTNIGRITAKAEGTVVITVTTEDGGKTATCTVTVIDPDKTAATAVSTMIAGIGEVTLDSEEAISAARSAYDALTDTQKALVENYETLTAAEAALEELKNTQPEPPVEPEPPVLPEEPEDTTITVTMRLIGAELASRDVDLSEGVYLPDYVTWLPTTTFIMNEGSTVYDLWVLATKHADISSIGASKNYVETVYSPFGGYELSEFTNGARSGWMYTINGSHPGFGLCEQTLSDGDTVIWHYVNDYAWEVEDWDSIGGSGWPQLSTGTNNYWNRWLMAPDVYGGKNGGISEHDQPVNPDPDTPSDSDDSSNLFSDIGTDDYYYTAVEWALEKGITLGTSTTTFSPNDSCTRAQMVTFLWRAAGEPKAKSTTCSFTDVDASAYYYEAVLWAVEAGITQGTSATTFSPDAICSRDQTVTFLWRASGKPDIKAASLTLPFVDIDQNAYYYDALLWVSETRITQGTSTTTFSPDDSCTRAQMVTFLYRSFAE